MTQYFGTEKLVHEEKQKGRFLHLYKMNEVETMVGFTVSHLSWCKKDGISKLAVGKSKRDIFFFRDTTCRTYQEDAGDDENSHQDGQIHRKGIPSALLKRKRAIS